MSEKLSYLLARADLTSVTRTLGWTPGPAQTKPPLGEVEHWGANLAGGDWCVIWSESETVFHARPRDLATLSQQASLILCTVQEAVMAFGAEGWEGGERAWSVYSLDGDELRVEGSPPDPFADLHRRARADRNDPSDSAYQSSQVPLDLASAMTGFHYGNVLAEGLLGPCHPLERLRGGLLARLLGRRN